MRSSAQKPNRQSSWLASGFAAASSDVADRVRALAAFFADSRSVLLEEGRLLAHFHTTHMTHISKLVSEAEANPALKDHIAFIDKGRERSYDNVVYNLEDDLRGVAFARKIYKEGADKRYVVVTPPVTRSGINDMGYEIEQSRPIKRAGDKGTIVLSATLEPEPGIKRIGDYTGFREVPVVARRLVQTDKIDVAHAQMEGNHHVILCLRTQIGLSLNFGAQRPIEQYRKYGL